MNTYAYVGGNPLTSVDLFGLAVGDHYPTIDAAAVAALEEINPASMANNIEYAGVIYRNWDGDYSYTAPNPGTPDVSDPGYAPLLHFSVADYHTHAACDSRYKNEVFSDQDKRSSRESGLPSYLDTPGGLIQRYDPISHEITKLINGVFQ